MELKADGIHAMTVCPGYVKTHFQSNALGTRPPQSILKGQRYAITAEECAEAIARGVERDARTVVVPRFFRMFVALSRMFPAAVESKLAAIAQNQTSA